MQNSAFQGSVIVVGPDRVGKTTVCRHLSEILGIPGFKFPSEKEIFKNGGKESLRFDLGLAEFLRQTGHRAVFDRGYPCEWVYSRVFGRETDHMMLDRIDTVHAEIGTVIVFLSSSEVPAEEDDLVPRERYHEIREGYRHFLRGSHVNQIVMETDEMIEAFSNGWDISRSFARSIADQLEILNRNFASGIEWPE